MATKIPSLKPIIPPPKNDTIIGAKIVDNLLVYLAPFFFSLIIKYNLKFSAGSA